ncbi:growth/differentiation factor 15 [Rhynchocyon petersi]
MRWLGPTPLHLSSMLLLLVSLQPPEGALSTVFESSPGLPGPQGVDASRYREFRKRYESLMKQLRVNQTWEDSSTNFVRILSPELRPGPGGHSYLRIPGAALSSGHPGSPRLHQALLQLSPTTPSPQDVTRPLLRLLAGGNSTPPVLLLHLPSPSALLSNQVLEAPPPTRAYLELHLRSLSARGRRNTHAHTAEACAAGATNCCGVQSRRVTLEELGWADWVLAPRELNVRACVGACPPRFRSASAHARIKARLHNLDPVSSPGPCCVPSSFEPVVLMHRDSDGRVSLTSYKDILVKDCHCA